MAWLWAVMGCGWVDARLPEEDDPTEILPPNPTDSLLSCDDIPDIPKGFSGSVDLGADCTQGTPDFVELRPADDGPAVRVFSVYQPDQEVITVEVDDPTPTQLVLVSYEPVQWQVASCHPDAIERVVLSDGSTVSGVDVPVKVLPGDVPAGYSWDHGETHRMVEELDDLLGVAVSSFAGCTQAAGFALGPGSGEFIDPPDCDAEPVLFEPPNLTLVADEDVTQESAWCASLSADRAVLFGLDSGDQAWLDVGPAHVDGVTGMGWLGDHLYWCRADDGAAGTLSRLSLVDGTLDISSTFCETLASWDGRLLVQADQSQGGADIVEITSWEDAVCRRSNPTDLRPWGSRFGTFQDEMIATTHSPGVAEITDLLTGEETWVHFHDFEDWVYGVGLTSTHVVLTQGHRGGVNVLDRAHGQTTTLTDIEGYHGLICFEN